MIRLREILPPLISSISFEEDLEILEITITTTHRVHDMFTVAAHHSFEKLLTIIYIKRLELPAEEQCIS
jgi:hypothetical protein